MKENNNRQTLLIIAAILFCVGVLFFIEGSLNAILNRVNASELLLREMNESLTEIAKAAPVSTPVPDTMEVPESSSAVEEPASYTQEELTKMLTSGKFEDLLTVATYPESTESQLLFIAAYCAKSDLGDDETSVVQLASALIDHPNATTAVMSTLARCKSQLVWLLVAQSDLCSDTTLATLAINYNSSYNGDINSIPTYVAIAILENPATTEQIIDEIGRHSSGIVERILDVRFGRITD